MSALNIVPLDSILEEENPVFLLVAISANEKPLHLVHVVEDSDAALVITTLLLLPVIWLGSLESSCSRPVAVSALPGCWYPLPRGGPVPALLYNGLEVLPVAAPEVALPAASPGVVEVLLLQQPLHPPVLRLAGDGDGVHAELAAVVASTLPVPLSVTTYLFP